MAAPKVTLNNGKQIPVLGLGAGPGMPVESIKYAISIGYRHFDTAWGYGTEPRVGEAIKDAISTGIAKREDFTVTTKLSWAFHERAKVVPACRESLDHLGLDYIDLYLIHWPISFSKNANGEVEYHKYDLVDTWRGMEECVALGLVKSIGLCNCTEEEIATVLKAAKIKPVANQVEVSLLCNQKKIVSFCKKNNIEVIAYSPLMRSAPGRPGQPRNFDDPILSKIGEKYGKTGSQVILRYILDIGVLPIPKSTNEERLKQNISLFDFRLTAEEIQMLEGFSQFEGIRYPTEIYK